MATFFGRICKSQAYLSHKCLLIAWIFFHQRPQKLGHLPKVAVREMLGILESSQIYTDLDFIIMHSSGNFLNVLQNAEDVCKISWTTSYHLETSIRSCNSTVLSCWCLLCNWLKIEESTPSLKQTVLHNSQPGWFLKIHVSFYFDLLRWSNISLGLRFSTYSRCWF